MKTIRLSYNILCVKIGEKIKLARTEKKLSVKDLSKKVSVSETALYKIEAGLVKNPGIFSIAEICKALDISIDHLLE